MYLSHVRSQPLSVYVPQQSLVACYLRRKQKSKLQWKSCLNTYTTLHIPFRTKNNVTYDTSFLAHTMDNTNPISFNLHHPFSSATTSPNHNYNPHHRTNKTKSQATADIVQLLRLNSTHPPPPYHPSELPNGHPTSLSTGKLYCKQSPHRSRYCACKPLNQRTHSKHE